MRSAKVYMKGIEAGTLTENDNGSYSFEYESGYFANASMPEVSLTLPKRKRGLRAIICSRFSLVYYPKELTKRLSADC